MEWIKVTDQTLPGTMEFVLGCGENEYTATDYMICYYSYINNKWIDNSGHTCNVYYYQRLPAKPEN